MWVRVSASLFVVSSVIINLKRKYKKETAWGKEKNGCRRRGIKTADGMIQSFGLCTTRWDMCYLLYYCLFVFFSFLYYYFLPFWTILLFPSFFCLLLTFYVKKKLLTFYIFLFFSLKMSLTLTCLLFGFFH